MYTTHRKMSDNIIRLSKIHAHAYIFSVFKNIQESILFFYPAKPSYSHCVELGRTDDYFSTAARVKKTVTPLTDKTVAVWALAASALW